MEFIGRKEELEQLERYFNSDTINTCAIFGRRRVGKSALIDRFCEDKPNIKFNLSGTDNAVLLETDFYPSPLVIQGAGAGAYQTASGILNDILK